jgi:predicted amidohydrolase
VAPLWLGSGEEKKVVDFAILKSKILCALLMKIAYLQPPYPDGKTIDSQSAVDEIPCEANQVADDTDLLVLPEYANCPGINDYEELRTFIRSKSTFFLEELAALARRGKLYIAVNITREVCGGLHNVTVLLDRDGNVIAEYQKIHLTEFERDALQMIPGNALQFAEIDGVRVAFATCFDVYFAEYFEALARQRPDIIILPSYQRSEKQHVILAQTAARAMDAGAFIIRSSYSMGAGYDSGGMSMVVHPNGEILSNAGQNTGIFYTEIDPHEKWLRPKSFGQPAVPARVIIEENRKPEIYR